MRQKVYIVYVIYQYDGYDGTEVYDTREKAIEAAEQLVFEFKEKGYVINTEYHDPDVTFMDFTNEEVTWINLYDGNGEVEITIEEKELR